MVNFSSKLRNRTRRKSQNPLEIYNTLDRKSETGPLRPSQEKVLSEWFFNCKDKKNNIIKLHTGEGKTLVGLLLLQSKINSNKGPCLYICPNIYLSKQVRIEAEKFGIPTCDFDANNEIPDDFQLGQKILITHVQKLFNGMTKFGIKNKSIIANTVVIDDSHACIDSIKDSLTIKVDSKHLLYSEILTIFKDDIHEQGDGSFLEIVNGEYGTLLPIPYWSWFDKSEEVTKAILKYKDNDEIKYSWPILKDKIVNCQAVISGKYLEISPILMPINDFGTFSRAQSRILMSATTQDDSFFIKGLGFDIDSISHPITNESLKWSGEKMILFPSLISNTLDREYIVNTMAKPMPKNNFGIVFLTPSFKTETQFINLGAEVAKSGNIFNCVKQLKNGNYAKSVVFVNRYDGIDLPDSSCRILILDSKPFFDSLLDRYEEECRPNSDIMNIRIAQKVEQGLGRSVRGEKDYSVIVVTGGDLVKFIKSPMTNKYFSAQTQKQIDIGIQVADFAKEDLKNKPLETVLFELINQSLQRDDDWKSYYLEEMGKISLDNKKQDLYSSLKLEYDAEKYFELGDFQKSFSMMQKLCDTYNSNPFEKGWYLQQLARYHYSVSKIDSNSLQKSAFQHNNQLLKPKEGIIYKKVNYINQNRNNRIIGWVSSFSNYSEMMISINGTLDDLSFGRQSEKFEAALMELGKAIGFISQRPDKEIKKGPDNLWCGVNDQYFLLECKNEVELTRAEINKHEAGQMNSHCGWFESEYGKDSKCKRILIIPTSKLSYFADFTHEVEIMKENHLKNLKNNVYNFFKELNSYNIHDINDKSIQQMLDTHNLNVEDLLKNYSEPYRKQNK